MPYMHTNVSLVQLQTACINVTNAMQVGTETGSKGAMALTGQTTMLGKEALTGKLIMLYPHTLLFILKVCEDNPAQDALQTSLQQHSSTCRLSYLAALVATVPLPPCPIACVSMVCVSMVCVSIVCVSMVS